jgi:hypothetical protein
MHSLIVQLQDWIASEPAASIWMVVAAALLFGTTCSQALRSRSGPSTWLRGLAGSAMKTLLVVALAGMMSSILGSSVYGFIKLYDSYSTNGSLSNQAWERWNQRYGGNFYQADLQVNQYVNQTVEEEVQTDDPSAPPLYRHKIVEQPVEQNSLASFNGKVTVTVADPVKKADAFNGFLLDAVYEYQIVNPVDSLVNVRYYFPLYPGARVIQDISVKLNGQEAPGWRIADQAIAWESSMQPGEKDLVSIHYVSRGMDSFIFDVPVSREVTNFKLTVALDTDNCFPITSPDNGGIRMDVKTSPPYKVFTWTIDRAILTPRLGLRLIQNWPYDPYPELIQVLPISTRAFSLFFSLLLLTLLICGTPVELRQLALLAGLFTVPFLVLMAGCLPHLASISPRVYAGLQVGMLPILTLPILLIAFFVLRKMPRTPLILTLILMALFLGGYPLSGLIQDQKIHNAFESILQAGMIAYVFLVTLVLRVRGANRPK